jgi:(p)ppGpp synthase/HD superfamily hydrolase
MDDREKAAMEFAIEKHKDQTYGEKPYSYHLQQTAITLGTYYDFNVSLMQAAWLHDVVEDCCVTVEELNELFGPVVATLVWAVSGTGLNRKECNESICQKLILCPSAVPVKLADRIANVEAARDGVGTPSLIERYRQEHDAFERVLKPLRVEVAMWKRLNDALGFGVTR